MDQSADRPVVRPSPEDRCAECGERVEHEWFSFREDPDHPERVLKHFSGVIKKAIEPEPVRPERPIRDITPDDLGHFFHPWCAPQAKFPAEIEKAFAEVLAKAIAARWAKKNGRWARSQEPISGDGDLPKYRAYVASAGGRRVFAFARAEWERLRGHEGKLVEIELERAARGSLEETGAVIAGLVAECHVDKSRIEIWPYRERDEERVKHVQDYAVLENFVRRLNLPMFAERAGTQDSPKLRKHLREHVFLVRRRPEKGRWQPKARAVERIVFMRAEA